MPPTIDLNGRLLLLSGLILQGKRRHIRLHKLWPNDLTAAQKHEKHRHPQQKPDSWRQLDLRIGWEI